MEIYFDSKDLKCKTPFGAVGTDKVITFTAYCKDGVFVQRAYLVIYQDGNDVPLEYPMSYIETTAGMSSFSVDVDNLEVGLYWYHFVFYTEEGEFRKDKDGYGFQLTIFDEDYKTPDDVKGGVIYHAFVDRFAKGKDKNAIFTKKGVLKAWDEPLTLCDPDGVYRANDFYGGNFQGIIDKLDYLKDLGVTLLYLSPIFKSSSTHRYDTGNYLEVDELLGTESKFKELIDKAKDKGIDIMLDGVFNHTGADSIYFNKFGNYDSIGAYQSMQSPYFNWYTFYDFPDNYHCWWGVTVCPTIKPTPNGFRDLITNPINGVINKWTSLGVKAWRLDVVDELAEDFVKDIRKAVKRGGKDKLLIGEVWEDASNKIAYDTRRHYFQGEELDGVMNYVYKNAILAYTMGGTPRAFKNAVYELVENYPKQSLDCSMNLIGTHDTVRALTILGGATEENYTKSEKNAYRLTQENYALAVKRLKIASALEFMLPGIPSIYYGDEIGMQGFEDPMNREPMKWDDINEEVHSHYVALGKIRKDYRAEMCGSIEIEDDDILIMRRKAKKTITLIANTCDYRRTYPLDTDKYDLLTGKHIKGRLILEPNEVYIIEE